MNTAGKIIPNGQTWFIILTSSLGKQNASSEIKFRVNDINILMLLILFVNLKKEFYLFIFSPVAKKHLTRTRYHCL